MNKKIVFWNKTAFYINKQNWTKPAVFRKIGSYINRKLGFLLINFIGGEIQI